MTRSTQRPIRDPKPKTRTRVSILSWGLMLALAGTAVAWRLDHVHLASNRKEAQDQEQLRELAATITELRQQQAQSDVKIAQLKSSPHPKAASPAKADPPSAPAADAKLAATQHDDAFLEAQFNDLRSRNDKTVLEESRYFQLYTAWKEICLSQREYIKGIYVDDLALRTAAKQAPYAPLSVRDPEAEVAGAPASP